MTASFLSPEPNALAPLRTDERIQALDVVRGVALIGIFLMNVEWFNRASGEMGSGLPAGLTGADWWASRLIYVLVQGKFWTMFSLLFGMGFAVMLTRAERAGRDFLRPYLRRIAALAVFGAAHHILIWNGDILFSYAVGAIALLIVLYGNWKVIAAALVAVVGIGFIPKLDAAFGVAASLAMISLAALFLRGEKRMKLRGLSLPVFSFVLLVVGVLAAAVATLLWALPNGPKEPRVPVTVVSIAILTLGVLAARFHNPVEARPRRLGMTLYLFPFLMMTTFGAVLYFAPSLAHPPAAVASSNPEARKAEAQQQAERAKRLEQRREDIQTETRVMSKGTYLEAVKYRVESFAKKAPEEAGFAIVLVGMFLLGSWFVRSGIMEDTRAHLPLFRKLAWIALPVGVGLGLLGSALATTHVPGNMQDGFQLASGLLMLGNLPASLGYVGLIVVLLHSDSPFSRIRLLAPLGRMALTTYITQSLVSAVIFYGHGFGQWGLGRAWQVLYVAIVFALQVAFSHWWLGHFRFGPLEWLWRALTYWTLPAMRVEAGITSDSFSGPSPWLPDGPVPSMTGTRPSAAPLPEQQG